MKTNFFSLSLLLGLATVATPLFGADAMPTPAPAAASATSTAAPDASASAATTAAAASAAASTRGTAPARGSARGRGGRGAAQATPADVAEMAKLNDLPLYASGLGDGDYSTGPTYQAAVEQTPRDNVPKGRVETFTINAADSKFYPNTGLRGTTDTRNVTVYIPSQYVPGTAAPFIISCDAYGASKNQLPTILDNMIADHRLPVMIAIMSMNGGGDGPGSERGLEYDTVSGKFAEFVEAEILPQVEKNYGVTLSKNPDARMTYGGSSGGAAAFSMAWFHPELYHRVLCYSGTFVNQQAGPDAPHGAWNYHETFIPNNPAKPLRIWLEAGQNDNSATTASAGFHNWLIANERMAAVLKAKGYHYQLVYAKGAGHTDRNAIAQTLPEALEYVWRGYPIEPAKDTKAAPAVSSAPAATTASVAPVADPRADLKTLVPEMIRLMDANDVVGAMRLAVPPANARAAEIAIQTMAQNSQQLANIQTAFKQTAEMLRSIQNQTPAMNSDSTLATYALSQPGPDGRTTISFHQTNGLWYPTGQ